MDILKFKVKNSELQRKDKKIISNKSEETAYIQVTFQKNSDWENQTKFAIFENDKKQQTTVLLGDMQTCLIPIPAIALTGYYFIISIYAGDRLTTNFLRVGLNPSHYNTKPDSPSQIDKTNDDRYYTKTEMNTKLNGKANSSHTHNISDVTGLSTSLDGKMGNNYSVSTIESNFFAHKIGNIVIVTWWGGTLSTTQDWVDWKTLPYKSCNTQPIWVNGDGVGCDVRVKVPPNSNKLQVLVSGGTGSIRAGMIVYPTK